MPSLEQQYGPVIKPEELAEYFHIPVTTLLRNKELWGGFEAAPGKVRFLEKKVEAILNPQQIPNGEATPKINFYSDGQFWRIGAIGKDAAIKKTKGVELSHFLLSRPNAPIACEELEQLGKASKEYLASTNGCGKFQYTDETSRAIDQKSKAELRALIKCKNEILVGGEYEPPDQLLEVKETIKLAKESLYEKERNYHSPESKKPSNRVGKVIRRAIAMIVKELPYLEHYLNNHTIKTGNICQYRPLLEKQPKWILHKNEL